MIRLWNLLYVTEHSLTLYNYCKNQNKSIELENGIYNHTIFSTNKNCMNINCDDSNFMDIYYDKLAATLDIILSVKKLGSEGVSNN